MMLIYYLEGFSKDDQQFIDSVLADKRGWAGQGYIFKRVQDPAKLHVRIMLRTNSELRKHFKHRPDLNGLSVTDIGGGRPTEIWINKQNWTSVPVDFVGDIECYRCYLIQHEMGHALGYDHVKPVPASESESKSLACPVMYQQTRGTKNICKANPWRKHEIGVKDTYLH